MNRPNSETRANEQALPATYAGSRSATHRPTLNLHGLRDGRQNRSLQLSWVGLIRPPRR